MATGTPFAHTSAPPSSLVPQPPRNVAHGNPSPAIPLPLGGTTGPIPPQFILSMIQSYVSSLLHAKPPDAALWSYLYFRDMLAAQGRNPVPPGPDEIAEAAAAAAAGPGGLSKSPWGLGPSTVPGQGPTTGGVVG